MKITLTIDHKDLWKKNDKDIKDKRKLIKK